MGEIAIEAGLVNRAGPRRLGRMAEQRKLPLVVVLVRELGVDEVALVAALRTQTAQIPIATRQSMIPDDLEAKLSARVGLLVAKGVVTEAELAEALRKAKG